MDDATTCHPCPLPVEPWSAKFGSTEAPTITPRPQNPSTASLEALRSPLNLHPLFTEPHDRVWPIKSPERGALGPSYPTIAQRLPIRQHPSQEREGKKEEEEELEHVRAVRCRSR